MPRELLSEPVKHWSIYRDTNGAGQPCLVVVREGRVVNAGFSGTRYMNQVIDYPILFPSGVIAYDRPRMIPVRVQSAVKAAMKRLAVPAGATVDKCRYDGVVAGTHGRPVYGGMCESCANR